MPGGLAFLTSSLDRLNACFNEVITANDGYQIEPAGEPRWKPLDLTKVCCWDVMPNGFPSNLNTLHGPKRRLNAAPGIDSNQRPEGRLRPMTGVALVLDSLSLVRRHRLYPRRLWGSRNVE